MNESKKIKKVMEATGLLNKSVNEDITSGLNHCINDLKNLAYIATNEIKIVQGCIDDLKGQDQDRINSIGYSLNLVQDALSRAYSQVDNSIKQTIKIKY